MNAAESASSITQRVNAAAGQFRRGVRLIAMSLRYGWPQCVLEYGDSPGDNLLCSTVLHEWRRRTMPGRLWMSSNFPELFRHNPDVDRVVPYTSQFQWFTLRSGGRAICPNYAPFRVAEDRSESPSRHILSIMCRKCGMTGPVALRPYLHLTDKEKLAGRIAERQVVLQSSGLSARMSMLNKEWGPANFASVAESLKGRFPMIQLGSASDPLLPNVTDLRGRTTIRQSAAILANSICFVGLVGFLMHLSRAVDCRAVIVYGGRETPAQSGYSSNENLCTSLPCSPCWLWNRCDFGRECLTRILPRDVVSAIDRQLPLYGSPIPVDHDDLQEDWTP